MFGPFPGLSQIDARYDVRADFAGSACAAPDAQGPWDTPSGSRWRGRE